MVPLVTTEIQNEWPRISRMSRNQAHEQLLACRWHGCSTRWLLQYVWQGSLLCNVCRFSSCACKESSPESTDTGASCFLPGQDPGLTHRVVVLQHWDSHIHYWIQIYPDWDSTNLILVHPVSLRASILILPCKLTWRRCFVVGFHFITYLE